MNLLYVCGANKARSATLAAYTIHINYSDNGRNLPLFVDSCAASRATVERLRERGKTSASSGLEFLEEELPELLDHRVKFFDPVRDGEWADVILCADRRSEERIRGMIKKEYHLFSRKRREMLRNVHLAKDYGGSGGDPEIRDPTWSPNCGRSIFYDDEMEVMRGTEEAWRAMSGDCEETAREVLKRLEDPALS